MEIGVFKDFARDIFLLDNLFSSLRTDFPILTVEEAKETYQLLQDTIKNIIRQIPSIKSEITANIIIEPSKLNAYTKSVYGLVRQQRLHSKRVFTQASDIKDILNPELLGMGEGFWIRYLQLCDKATVELSLFILPLIPEDQKEQEVEEGNLYKLDKIREKLIYLKYIGVIDALRDKHKNEKGKITNARISRLLSPITGVEPDYMDNLIGSLIGYVENRNDGSSVYTKPALKAAIKCLNEVNIDTTELYEILMKLEKGKK